MTKQGIKKPDIADNAKTCYKIIKFGIKHFITPFRDVRIAKEVVNGDRPYKASSRNIPWQDLVSVNNFYDCVCVEGGYIHGYHQLRRAKAMVKDFESYNSRLKYLIYRCQIPAGTEYFDGQDGDICARQILFKKCVYKNF